MGSIESMVRKLLPAQEQGFYWDHDGKMRRKETGPMPETPWIYQKMTFQCVLWHEIFFNLISDKQAVHSHCHECFKVVIKPRTVEELFALAEFQELSDLECKCGIELREFVKRDRLYGGYFYCRGEEHGLEVYRKVTEWAEQTHAAGESQSGMAFEAKFDTRMPTLLKVGCTEFERSIGDVTNWNPTEGQADAEKWMEENIDYDPYGNWEQPDVIKESVRIAWIKWAHHHGDMTYVKFMPNGKPLDEEPMYFSPPYKTFHEGAAK